MKCFAASVRKLRYGLESLKRTWLNVPICIAPILRDLERGARNPTLLTIKKLAKGLDVSAADLLSETKCNR